MADQTERISCTSTCEASRCCEDLLQRLRSPSFDRFQCQQDAEALRTFWRSCVNLPHEDLLQAVCRDPLSPQPSPHLLTILLYRVVEHATPKQLKASPSSKQRNLEAVKQLVSRGAYVDGQDGFSYGLYRLLFHPSIVGGEWRKAPLHIAAAQGSTDVVSVLLQAGADVGAKMEWGASALQLAVECKHERPRLIKVLLDAGASVSARDYTSAAALMHCIRHCAPGHAAPSGQLLKVLRLEEPAACPDELSGPGPWMPATLPHPLGDSSAPGSVQGAGHPGQGAGHPGPGPGPPQGAVADGGMPLGRDGEVALLSASLDGMAVAAPSGRHAQPAYDAQGSTALFHAMLNRHEQTAIMLLDHACSPLPGPLSLDTTALALSKSMFEVMLKLLSMGVLEKTFQLSIPQHRAALQTLVNGLVNEVVKWEDQRGGVVNPSAWGCIHQILKRVHGADPGSKHMPLAHLIDPGLLHHAIMTHNLPGLRSLLDADPGAVDYMDNDVHTTPIHTAIQAFNYAAAAELVQRGAELHMRRNVWPEPDDPWYAQQHNSLENAIHLLQSTCEWADRRGELSEERPTVEVVEMVRIVELLAAEGVEAQPPSLPSQQGPCHSLLGMVELMLDEPHWTPGLHHRWPPRFRAAVRSLLLAMHRGVRMGGAADRGVADGCRGRPGRGADGGAPEGSTWGRVDMDVLRLVAQKMAYPITAWVGQA